MQWSAFDDGRTIGKAGSEDGIILHDDEYADTSRITLEECCANAPFSITCGIYGWFFHTRFFSDRTQAFADFEAMRQDLASIVQNAPRESEPDAEDRMAAVSDAINAFCKKFP